MDQDYAKHISYRTRILTAWLVVVALCVPFPSYGQGETTSADEPLVTDFTDISEPYASFMHQLIGPLSDPESTSSDAPGLITLAEIQAGIAVEHTGFLQDAITVDSFKDALKHTEHIVNMVDGEDGDFYGDLDQDGQIQNPGDGIGVRTYLLGAEVIVQELADAIENGAFSITILEQSTIALVELSQGMDVITQIQSQAITLLSTGTMEELNPEAQELAALVESLAQIIGEVKGSLMELSGAIQSSQTQSLDSLSGNRATADLADLRATVANDLITIDVELASALEQLNIAIQHTGFLQDAVTDASVEGAHQHTEHIVNILDGADGPLYGDLDQNGQTQNPGDGVGVLIYQTIAQSTAQSLADTISVDSSDSSIRDSSDSIVQNIGASIETVMMIQENALKISGASAMEEIIPIALKMATLIEKATAEVLQGVSVNTELNALLSREQEPSTELVEALVALQTVVANDLKSITQGVNNTRTQLDIAIQHSGFLQESLNDNNLEGVKTHTEHVTNLLEGEKSPVYGDLNGDGLTQNPGDGFGIRTYLKDLMTIAGQLETSLNYTRVTAEISKELLGDNLATTLSGFSELLAQLTGSTEATVSDHLADSTAQLLQLSVSTTVEDANPIAASVKQLLLDTDKVLDELGTQSAELEVALTEAVATATESTTQAAADTAAYNAVTIASEQLELATTHVGLMQDALARDDLISARIHSEQIINIIEGQSGIYYGDLDGDGQAQNSGDGVGVRAYLDEAIRRYAALADEPDMGSHINQIEEVLANIDEIRQALFPATETAYKIFAVDTTTEAQPFWDDIDERLSAAGARMTTTLSIRINSMAQADDKNATTMILGNPPYNPSNGDVWTSGGEGGTYVFISAGTTVIGADADKAASPREQPAHDVELAGFWIQQTETTNAQYSSCVVAGVCTEPDNKFWNQDAYATHPVHDVNWSQAMIYAQWAGARLPTEAEWEKACRSSDARLYPWGDEAPDELLANFDNNVGDTSSVGSYPDGATAEGLLDMSGNVWEWTSTLNRPYPYSANDGREDPTAAGNRVVRGGSYSFTRYQASCIARTGFNAETGRAGIRLVLLAKDGEWVNPVDNARYVLVDDGSFTMGASASQAISNREQPEHIVELAAFWIQSTETTNGQYAACVLAGVCEAPVNNFWDRPEKADFPVTDVTWEQAQTYAAYVGGRLPTEAEWEKACRGSDGRLYPWGNDDPNGDVSNYDNIIGETTPVGAYPEGVSPYGAFDMSGNVWEWTSSQDQRYPYVVDDGREDPGDGKRIMRGGSFYYTRYQVSCTARTGFEPTTQGDNFGFRIVIDNP